MVINTCSAAISLARELEKKSAEYYERLSAVHADKAELFRTLAKENRRMLANLERTYQYVITDAIEGCFAFNMEPERYEINALIDSTVEPASAINQAIKMEEVIVKFYQDAYEQSKATMADVPREFKIIARKRESRIAQLKALAGT